MPKIEAWWFKALVRVGPPKAVCQLKTYLTLLFTTQQALLLLTCAFFIVP